jgi:hypothetical protein
MVLGVCCISLSSDGRVWKRPLASAKAKNMKRFQVKSTGEARSAMSLDQSSLLFDSSTIGVSRWLCDKRYNDTRHGARCYV